MTSTTLDLNVTLHAGQEVNNAKLDQLTRQVHKDISQVIGAHSVRRAQSGEVPADAKGLPIDLNTLIVSLASAGVITALIQLLKEWALRAEGRTVKVRTEINGNVIEFEYSPTATSEEALMAFAEKLIQLLDRPRIERP